MVQEIADRPGFVRALLVGTGLLCLGWSWLFFSFTADDSFITFRYGRNLIEHGVWNWNASGPRAEAYTSGLYALLSIVPAALGIAPAPLFKLLGVAALLLTLQRLWRFGGLSALLFGAAVMAFTPFLFVHVASGLETPVFILLLVEIALRLLSGRAAQGQATFYALLVLLPLVRPEGAVFSAAAALLLIAQIGWRNVHWRPLAIAAICGLIYFVVRWIYFGQLLPTPFYAKTGFNPANLIANLLSFKLYLAVGAILFALIPNRIFRWLLAAQLGVVLLLYAPAFLQMNFADRFPLQALLPLVLVVPVAIGSIETQARRWRLSAFATMALMAGIGNLTQSHFTRLINYSPSANEVHRALGLALAPLQPRGYSIAMADSGLIAFHAGWRAIDLVGLADSEVARHGNSLAYMEQTKPDLIVLYSLSGRPQDISRAGFGHEAASEFLQRHPQLQPVVSLPWNGTYSLIVFRRADLPERAQLDEALKKVETHAQAWQRQRFRDQLLRALSLRDAFL